MGGGREKREATTNAFKDRGLQVFACFSSKLKAQYSKQERVHLLSKHNTQLPNGDT